MSTIPVARDTKRKTEGAGGTPVTLDHRVSPRQTRRKREPTRAELLAALAGHVEQLADPHQVVTPITDWTKSRNRKMARAWAVRCDPLLTQLLEALTDARHTLSESGSHTIPGSRPPGAFEALAIHTAITIGAAKWIHHLGHHQRDTAHANLHGLVGAAPTLDDPQLRRLAADIATWHHQASVAIGWTSPAYRPHGVPCPNCGCHDTLRVNVAAHVARCINPDRDQDDEPLCGATWDAATIGVLAEHIKTYAPKREQARRKVRVHSGGTGHGWR